MSLDSSTEQTTEETPDVIAESSTATEDVQPETALEHVNTLLAVEGDEAPSTSTEEGEQQAPEDDLPFNEHPRFKEVIEQKNHYKEMAQPFEQAKELGLNGDDIQQAIALMQALKSDPEKATELLNPHLENLQRVNGLVFDEDIQSKVDQGLMDESSAKELQKFRVQGQIKEQQAEQTELQNSQNAMASEVSVWEQEVKASDPDFEMKQPVVMEIAQGLIAQRQPKTAEDAKAIVIEAYDKVTQLMSATKPKANSIEPLHNTKTPAKAPEPTSALEAAQLALARKAN